MSRELNIQCENSTFQLRIRIEQKNNLYYLNLSGFQCGKNIEKMIKFDIIVGYTYDCHSFTIETNLRDISRNIIINNISDRNKNLLLDFIRPIL